MTGAAILGCAGPRLSDDERRFFADAQPWGFILFSRNVETPDQVRALTGDLRGAVGRNAPILIDQEGGRVQRLRPPHWRLWPPPLEQTRAAGTLAGRAMFLRCRIIAAELSALGIDVNCSPSADIADADTHPFLRNRCYGEDAATVIEVGRAAAQGLAAGGVTPVLKHAPGHGRARADSHSEAPTVDDSAETLRARDFSTFRALADLPMAMTAHVVFSAFDRERPATVSPTMVGLIREEIGFDGLLMTDDISMNALPGDLAERCSASLSAGCDVVLHCNGVMAEMETVASVAGRLSGRSAERAERALARRPSSDGVDIASAEAELEALLKGETHG